MNDAAPGRTFRAGPARLIALGLACADYWLRPGLKTEYGGPFNDQQARARLCERLAAFGSIRAVVETGTYRGTTSLFLARLFETPIYSVEINPRYYYYACLRTRSMPNVRLFMGDSRRFLDALARDPDVPKADVFFYLDAHRVGNLPLREEIEIIRHAWDQSLVMIDDFEVPGDPDYRFNEYGPGIRLGADLLSTAARGYRHFYPSTSPHDETGFRRGCVLLVPEGRWAERLRTLSLVRERS